MIVQKRAHIAVRFDGDVPISVDYDGAHYWVSDEPTRLQNEIVFVTHPPTIDGWRFQATDRDGQARVFDIRQRGDAWELIRVYD